jgi:HSP20 family protein
MANIVRRERPELPSRMGGWDPFRMIRDMMRWDPFRELGSDPFREFEPMSGWTPSFDVKETNEGIVIRADVPGVADKDLSVSLVGNRLTVSGKREGEERRESEHYHACERSCGAFSRSFTLPEDVEGDKVLAELKDGVLHLMLPRHPNVKTKQIPIRAK